MKTLEENAPTKTKIVRGSKKSHMNRTFCRAIMKRSTLKRIANKIKRDNVRKYKDQRNLVVKLNIQSKRHHFRMMQAKRNDNDKEIWKTAKPPFSNRNPTSEKIVLIEDGKILLNDAEVAKCLNEYFCNITDSFDIDQYQMKMLFNFLI